MGRKLNLGPLTEEEEKAILRVIRRDYTVRKVESDRIGKLSKSVEKEEQKQQEVVKDAVQEKVPIDSLCAKCGSKFMWLINPKTQCNGCDLYFCKNKIDCIVYDKLTEKCFCNACSKQRELQSYAGEWFYSKLKGKFRRHGGAKVSREFQKKKKSRKSESDSSLPPTKPPRTGLLDMSPISSLASTPVSVRRQPSERSNDTISIVSKDTVSSNEATERKMQQDYDMEMDAVVIETGLQSDPPRFNEMEIQTDDDMDDRLPAIKEELEAAISKILLPKLEELKKSQIEHQTEVDRQQKVEDAVKLAEEMIDKALERAREKHNQRPEDIEKSIILAKYLADSKTELMDKVTTQLHDESLYQQGQTSQRSSMRETGTMTETSDSEMESLSSASGRKKVQEVPLSERLGNLSPDSLRKTLNQSTNSSGSSVTQGIVLQKDQLIARADIDNTLGQILDEHGVRVHGTNSPQEFSTELKFTAVGSVAHPRFPSGEVSDNSEEETKPSQKLLSESENWSTPEMQKRPSQFGKAGNKNSSNSLMSIQNHVASPYENYGKRDSDSDDREHVEEELVLASLVRRPDGPMSPQALMSTKIDTVEELPEKKPHLPVGVAVDPKLIESLSKDLDQKEKTLPKDKTPQIDPVVEELILAVDKEAKEFHEPPSDLVKLSGRYSHDSAYFSDNGVISPQTPSSESELSAIPELSQEDRSEGYDSNSDFDSSSSSNVSERRTSSKILQPQRHSVTIEHKPFRPQLSYEDDLIADRDDLGDKLAEAMARNKRNAYEPEQQEISLEASYQRHDSISSMSDGDTYNQDEDTVDEDEAPTPTGEPGIEESAVALRMINNKTIDVLSDAMQKIEDAKGQGSDSSRSSKTCSAHGSVEELHKMNEAEEAVYKNAAKTFVMEERIDQLERVGSALNYTEPGSVEKLEQLEAEARKAEVVVDEVRQGLKSIDEIMRELRGAGLQVQRGGFKRNSLDSATTAQRTEQKKEYNRYSLPPQPVAQHPVNAVVDENPYWLKNTFTVVPGSTAAPPLEGSVNHSTPKPKSASISSHSSASSRSRIHSEEERLVDKSEIKGLTAEELEEARVPTPVPRRKKETFQIVETATIPAPAPRPKKETDKTEGERTAEESISVKDVKSMVKHIEGRASSIGSGTEYSEPLIKQGLQSGSESEGERKKISKRAFLPHQTFSTESESSEQGESTGKRTWRIKKDNSWMIRRESDLDSDTGSIASTSSRKSTDTARSSKSSLFQNLSAAEQREMARIALLHLPETAIAEDKYQTKTIKYVRTGVKSPPPQEEVGPVSVTIVEQQEVAPTQAPNSVVTTAEVHDESSSRSDSSPKSVKKLTLGEAHALVMEQNSRTPTSPMGLNPSVSPRFLKLEEAPPKGTNFNTGTRHSYNGSATPVEKNEKARSTVHLMESPLDLDRSQEVRGSITMRGGKMVMTSTPESKAKPEFQDIPE